MPAPNPQSTPPYTLHVHFCNHKLFGLWGCFCSTNKFLCILFLDSTYVSDIIWCLSLTSLNTILSRSIFKMSTLLRMSLFHSFLWLIFQCIHVHLFKIYHLHSCFLFAPHALPFSLFTYFVLSIYYLFYNRLIHYNFQWLHRHLIYLLIYESFLTNSITSHILWTLQKYSVFPLDFCAIAVMHLVLCYRSYGLYVYLCIYNVWI